MIRCSKCEFENKDGSKFCKKCGARINGTERCESKEYLELESGEYLELPTTEVVKEGTEIKKHFVEQKAETERQKIIEKEYMPVSAKPPSESKSGLYLLIFFIIFFVVIFAIILSIPSGQNNQSEQSENGGGSSTHVFVVVHNEHSAQYVDIWVDGDFSKTIWVGSYSSSSCSVYVGSGTHYLMAKGQYYEGSSGANVKGGDDIILYV